MKKIATLTNTIFFSFIALVLCCGYAVADDPCPTLREYMSDGIGENFILNSAYQIIAKACSNVANFSWNTFARSLQAVVGLGTAIYIAVYTLKNIGSFSQQDTSAYLSNEKTGIIPLAVKMAAIVWLLGNQEFLYKYLIGLAVTTGMEIGTLLNPNSLGRSFSSTNNLESLFALVIAQIITFNDAIYRIVATGQLLFCWGSSPDGLLNYYWVVLVMGGALVVYGWLLIIGVSFYMLDVLFRLGVGCIVLPFAIACGLSKLTANYTEKTWNLFMNVCFNFIMLGIIIDFTCRMIEKCVGLDIPEDKVFNEADIKQISENIGFKAFIITSLCCMVAYQLFMQIGELVEKISGASSVGKVGAETGAKVAQAAVRPAKGIANQAGKLGAAAGQEAGSRISNKYQDISDHLRNRIQSTPAYQSIANSRVANAYRKVRHALRLDER